MSETRRTTNDELPRDFLSIVAMLQPWRRFILLSVLVVTLLVAGVSLLLPNRYLATASVMPPKEQNPYSMLGGAGSLLKSVSSLTRGGGLTSQGQYNYFAILNSRIALEEVARHFDLATVYEIDDSSMEKTIKELAENISFERQEDDYITIEVIDTDPQRAADMANYFVVVLNQISTRLGTLEARNNREFIEAAVAATMERLSLAEDSLREFQKRTGMLLLPDENMASVNAVADVYAEKTLKEVEVAVLERTVGKENPVYVQSRVELDELTHHLDRIPDIGIGSLRLYREVVIQQKVLEFLIPMQEQARVEENKTVPVTVSLDKAIPPEKKHSPKRSILVLLAASTALLFSLGYALLTIKLDHIRRTRPTEYEQMVGFFRWRDRSGRM